MARLTATSGRESDALTIIRNARNASAPYHSTAAAMTAAADIAAGTTRPSHMAPSHPDGLVISRSAGQFETTVAGLRMKRGRGLLRALWMKSPTTGSFQ